VQLADPACDVAVILTESNLLAAIENKGFSGSGPERGYINTLSAPNADANLTVNLFATLARAVVFIDCEAAAEQNHSFDPAPLAREFWRTDMNVTYLFMLLATVDPTATHEPPFLAVNRFVCIL